MRGLWYLPCTDSLSPGIPGETSCQRFPSPAFMQLLRIRGDTRRACDRRRSRLIDRIDWWQMYSISPTRLWRHLSTWWATTGVAKWPGLLRRTIRSASTSLSVLSRPHPAAFAAAMDTDVEQLSRSGHHTRFAAPEATDELLADDFGNLRRGLEASGVSANDVSAYLGTLAERPALDATLNWYRAVGSSGLGDPACPIVGVPTLYVWGGRDSSVGRPAAELTSSFVSGPFTFIEIASSGHFVTDDGGGPETVEAIAAHILESAG